MVKLFLVAIIVSKTMMLEELEVYGEQVDPIIFEIPEITEKEKKQIQDFLEQNCANFDMNTFRKILPKGTKEYHVQYKRIYIPMVESAFAIDFGTHYAIKPVENMAIIEIEWDFDDYSDIVYLVAKGNLNNLGKIRPQLKKVPNLQFETLKEIFEQIGVTVFDPDIAQICYAD